MKVLLYGRLAEAIGSELEVGAPPGTSVAEVRELIAADYPGIQSILRHKREQTFVGDRLIRDDYVLAAGETLEFLPPVSGG